jgi:tRNA G18 (ribose-2'-O)-methylase SpoU
VILPVPAPADSRLEPYRRVGDHAWLRSQGLFVAEGRLLLERLVAARGYQIQSALVSPAALEALRPLVEQIESPVYVAAQDGLKELTGFNFHRGCLALARRPPAQPIETFLGARLLLGLEGIGNPDNIGGAFRAAAAFNADGVLLNAGSGDPLYRKALRTSMGAVLQVPFAGVDGWHDGWNALRQAGFRIAALTTERGAMPLDRFAAGVAAGDRLLLVAGAEGSGLSDASLTRADARVTIPMSPGVDSLNVAVAIAIALSRVWQIIK